MPPAGPAVDDEHARPCEAEQRVCEGHLGVKLGIKLEVKLGVHLGSISGARTALRHVGPEEADRAQEGHVLEERE